MKNFWFTIILLVFYARDAISGFRVVSSSYLGTPGWDVLSSLKVVDKNVYLTGYATGLTSVIGNSGKSDVFFLDFDASSNSVKLFKAFGGSDTDVSEKLIIDSSGYFYIVGWTNSRDFPCRNYSGNKDGFIIKLNKIGETELIKCIGGTEDDEVHSVAIDKEGNIYLTGVSYSVNFPVTVDAFQKSKSLGFGPDAFLVKLNKDAEIVYSTFFGGRDWDEAKDIAVDSGGNVYITGYTFSDNFPTLHSILGFAGGGVYVSGYLFNEDCIPPEPMRGIAGADTFVSKFSSSGQLLYSTYYSSRGDDWGNAIAVDKFGNIYIAGQSDVKEVGNANFPLYNPIQEYKGSGDAFISKIAASGEGFVYSTYLGGGGYDIVNDLYVDEDGNAYIVGLSFSPDFNDNLYLGNGDVFLAKIDAHGSLVSTLLIGGGEEDNGIAIDGSGGHIWITGTTKSNDFLVKNAFQLSRNQQLDGMLIRLAEKNNYLDISLENHSICSFDKVIVKISAYFERQLLADVHFVLIDPNNVSYEWPDWNDKGIPFLPAYLFQNNFQIQSLVLDLGNLPREAYGMWKVGVLLTEPGTSKIVYSDFDLLEAKASC